MATARVIQTGSGQTIHLPSDVHLRADLVEVVQKAGDIVELRPAKLPQSEENALALLDLIIELGELIEEAPEDPPAEDRPGLCD